MPTTKQSKHAILDRYLAEKRPARIGDAEWRELLLLLAPVSETYLRRLLRDSGLPLEPLIEGVRQDSFEELERTLLAIGAEYMDAYEAGDRERMTRCRRLVITGKEHARLAARRRGLAGDARSQKSEMASWMLLWLENPAVFPVWLRLRKRAAPSV